MGEQEISAVSGRLQDNLGELVYNALRGGGRGFPLATMNVVFSYFHWKIEEK